LAGKIYLGWVLWFGLAILGWLTLPALIPSPWSIPAALPGLWLQDGLGQELMTSVFLNFEAMFLTVIISFFVAYSASLPLMRPLSVLLSAGRFNSFVGLPLLLTLVFGDAHTIKVVLLSIAMSVFTVPAIIDVIGTIPKESYDDARVLGMGDWEVLWEVVFLGKIHEVIDVLRTNFSMGWMMLPMVEGLFRSEGGIGVLILQENKYLRLDAVYCLILVVGLVGMAQDRLILEIKKMFCPYAFLESA